jgi:alanine dehydrogenase
MALLLNESNVRELLTMDMALEAVEEAFARLADGTGIVQARQRLHVPKASYLHYMAAADAHLGYMGMKIYTSSAAGLRFIFPLFSASSGDLLALLEADYLGQMRTGAASGVATRLMARPDASTIGLIGTGLQARTQLQAIALVRKIQRVRVFGRDAARREKFAKDAAELLEIAVEAASTAEAAVKDADIIITATTASKPVVLGSMLRAGMHINAIGANFPDKRELDDDAVLRSDIVAVDYRAQAKEEAGDLIQAYAKDSSRWDKVLELADIVAGRKSGRDNSNQITLFKSSGIAIEDVTTAARVYEKAIEKGVGRQIPMWEGREMSDQRPARPK